MAAAAPVRVLLVDDEWDMLALLEVVVAKLSWEIVGRAPDGADAIRIAQGVVPDIAVIDYMMPGANGIEIAEWLKERHPGCRVLLFSAFDLEAQVEEDPNIDRFLKKGDVRTLERVLAEMGDGVRGGRA
jgi:DNA-binding NarL/FixJ family response regulator